MSGYAQKPGEDALVGIFFDPSGKRGPNRRISRFGDPNTGHGNRSFKRFKVINDDTIAFVGGNTITDSGNRLYQFHILEFIGVFGGPNNNFLYNPIVVTPGAITVLGAVVNEAAGNDRTLYALSNKRVSRFIA